MEFSTVSSLKQRKKADLLVLPFWKDDKGAKSAADSDALSDVVDLPLKVEDFKGKEGEILVLYPSGLPEKRVALLGLGEKGKISVEILRRAYASLTKFCRQKQLQTLNLLMPEIQSIDEEQTALGISEGLLLSNYSFDSLKHDAVKTEKTVLLKNCVLIGATDAALVRIKKAARVCEGVMLARDLVNGNADDVTPQTLAHMAKTLAKKHKNVKATVFDKKRIEKEGMGLLLAVSRGSSCDPAFIILEYTGNPKSKDRTVIVGKGVTYDTGGLNLKPTGSMETMKCDMSGAAAALGTVHAAASCGLKKNVTAVIPTTENSIGSRSYKPGDVYKSYSGKTVEIGNTDAEGRLILADALAYASKKLNPSRMIDLATLTGAVVICLGSEATGLMTTDDRLAEGLTKAGEATFERVWRLPLFEEYKKQLKSGIADIKNVGGRPAGTITAALFLKEFVGDTPWAHLDIAGTAFYEEAKRYHPQFGSGVGVRLLMEFLEHHV